MLLSEEEKNISLRNLTVASLLMKVNPVDRLTCKEALKLEESLFPSLSAIESSKRKAILESSSEGETLSDDTSE